ncbi:MAG: YeiH family protein [Aminivibrio sp.]
MKKTEAPFFCFLVAVIILSLTPTIKTWAVGIALMLGAAASNIFPCAAPAELGKYRKLALNTAVVLFGFGLNIGQVVSVGGEGFWQTAVSLAAIIPLGYVLLRFFNLDKDTIKLITFGTSICGGSAIAAVSSVIKARDEDIGVAMGVVFLLNTAALFAFPLLAPLAGLSPEQYGVWCALSIHDTSSVVGAAAILGDKALSTATIMKLTRTLWITPIVFVLSLGGGKKGKLSVPLFIVLFIAASAAASFLPFPFLFRRLASAGKIFMAVALYLVGFGLHRSVIKKAGAGGILFGSILWAVSIGVGYLLAVA